MKRILYGGGRSGGKTDAAKRDPRLNSDTKSERVVQLRALHALPWAKVAELVGTTETCCRVLYHKRAHGKVFSIDYPDLKPAPTTYKAWARFMRERYEALRSEQEPDPPA